ncbi:MAG: hypothetical protein BGN92_12960 [Sphingobacteriales bacterium 41-5]|nr:MAG: hypothetical protein BGN92_12960 [Sphingobacteriales bacterium 41-5]
MGDKLSGSLDFLLRKKNIENVLFILGCFISDKINIQNQSKQDVHLLNCLLDKCFGEIRLPGF